MPAPTDHPTLPEVLALLLLVETKQQLEAAYASIRFSAVARTDEEKAALTNAFISAAARCWARRWPTSCCGD
jgi:hypothetical protein